MPTIHRLVPCLWFDRQAEAAVNLYVSIFPNSKVGRISRYGEAGKEIHGQEPGAVMAVTFELDGHPFMALNGGPMFKFTEAISFQLNCDTQDEIDHYWEKLRAGGDPNAQQCGWLKDQFGLSWQVVPDTIGAWLTSTDTVARDRAFAAMMKMKKPDVAALQRAFEGESA